MKFPRHNCGLFLEHNPHRDYYETIQEHLDPFNIIDDDWVSYEQKKKAYETQDYWSLQWYPTTPIGSYKLYAADLDILLEAALEVEKEYTNG